MASMLKSDFPVLHPPRGSRLSMRLLRVALFPLLLGILAGMVLLIAGTLDGPAFADLFSGKIVKALLWAGPGLIGGCMALFLVVAWGAVFVQVMEGSRGQPVPEPIEDPCHRPAVGVPTRELFALQAGRDGLAGLGVEPAGWFLWDNFAQLRVAAWQHTTRPEVAYVLFQLGGSPRLRIVRRFASGVTLMTTNRLTDVAVAPPASTYVQMLKTDSAAELWSWHLEAEMLFAEEDSLSRAGDERIMRSPGDVATSRGWAPPLRTAASAERESDPMGVFMEMVVRCAWATRARRLWLLRLNPFREFWRMSCLGGLSVKHQIEEGWVVAPGVRQGVCLPPDERE
jgi:hypothetical protein